MLGNKEFALLPTRSVFDTSAVEVAFGDGSVLERLGREEVVGETVLLDQLLGDDPEQLCPDFADRVQASVPRLVQGLVGGRVDGLVLYKRERTTRERSA